MVNKSVSLINDVLEMFRPIMVWNLSKEIKVSRTKTNQLISDFTVLDQQARKSIEDNGFAKVLVLIKSPTNEC